MPRFLLIGHIAHDETPDGPKLGGTVSYTGGALTAMGEPLSIVTSARPDDPVLSELPKSAALSIIEAPASTVFVNTYEGDVRRQIIRSRAEPLTLDHIPHNWRDSDVVHLAPLADEVDYHLAAAFPGAFVCATPQGWMRAWDLRGVVRAQRWNHAEALLPILSLTVFSEDDIARDRELEAYYASLAKLMIVTRAAKGCTVYRRGHDPVDVPAPSVSVVDATGAGDVFTGVFLSLYQRTKDPIRAAAAAVKLASFSVTRPGLQGAPTQDEIALVVGDLEPETPDADTPADADADEIEAYCVRCRTNVVMANPEAVWTSKGTPGTRGDCPICGTTVFRMGMTPAHDKLVRPASVRVAAPTRVKGANSKRKKGIPATYIAYAPTDAEFARKLAADLEASGVHTWLHTLEEQAGVKWAGGVHPALKDSAQMVIVLTAAALEDGPVKAAWQFFRAAKKPILIAHVEAAAEIPDMLRRSPRTVFGEDYQRAFRELLAALSA